MITNFLAIDLGASSGRVMLARWDGQAFALEEIHRFTNGPLELNDHMHWDVQRLWQEVKAGIAKYAARYSAPLAGIGIDTWGVDYGLLDSAGRLIHNPYHYRDWRTIGMAELVYERVPAERLYARTGIQFLQFNTLFQLYSLSRAAADDLARTDIFLMMPDLFHYWMTGVKVGEYTNATTTQFLAAHTRRWATDVFDSLGLPSRILPPLVQPGTLLGILAPAVRDEVGLRHDTPVFAVATHDTASAVAAIPGLDAQSVYISSGTWSLVGIELDQPMLTEEARRLNFTNEGGVGGTIRLLKNVGGLWLLQECQRLWQQQGRNYSWAELVALAEAAEPRRSLVDPDDPAFLAPDDMLAAIDDYCRRTNQPAPASVGALVRCCLESLALKYRQVIESLERLTGRALPTIRIVGGGSQNALLCQLTADACDRTVVAGPVEATALGNVMVQAIAAGYLPDIAAGRAAVARSVEQRVFTPRHS